MIHETTNPNQPNTMKTKTPKLTTTEKRAAAMCEAIRNSEGSYPVTVEWKRSSTWGRNPRIMYLGGKATSVSGCGYCKHSTALADALQWLGGTEDARHAIARTGGCGVSRVQAALAEQGWVLESVASGGSFDCYEIRRA